MKKITNKYTTDDPYFDKQHGVLKNKLGIIDQEELDHIESQALLNAYESTALEYSETHTFSEGDICNLHKIFLGEIYKWAGEYRVVDISSEEIRWCHAAFIESEMKKLNNLLSDLTPFTPHLSRAQIVDRTAKIQGELIVIHPFRDGNGRVARLLTDLLLMQAETVPMQRESFYDESFRQEYYTAIKEVWANVDYARLICLFDRLLP